MALHEFTPDENLDSSAEALPFAVSQSLDHAGCGFRGRLLDDL